MVEGDSFKQRGDLVWRADAPPRLLGRLDQLECQTEKGRSRNTIARARRAMPDGRKRRFNGVCGPQVLPVLRRKVVEGQQFIAIVCELPGGLRIFGRINVDETHEAHELAFAL